MAQEKSRNGSIAENLAAYFERKGLTFEPTVSGLSEQVGDSAGVAYRILRGDVLNPGTSSLARLIAASNGGAEDFQRVVTGEKVTLPVVTTSETDSPALQQESWDSLLMIFDEIKIRSWRL
jgi:hypothetical protein